MSRSGVTFFDPASGKNCTVELYDGRIRVVDVLLFFQALLVLWRDEEDEDDCMCILSPQVVDDTSLSEHIFSPGQVLQVEILPHRQPPQSPKIEEYKYAHIYFTVHGKTFAGRIRVNRTTLEFEISLRSLFQLLPGAKRVKLVSKDGDYEIELDEDHSKEFVPYIGYPGVGTEENPWLLVRADGICFFNMMTFLDSCRVTLT